MGSHTIILRSLPPNGYHFHMSGFDQNWVSHTKEVWLNMSHLPLSSWGLTKSALPLPENHSTPPPPTFI